MSRKKKISKGDPRRKFHFKTPKDRAMAELRAYRHSMRELKLESTAIIQFAEHDKRLTEPKLLTAWKPETKAEHQKIIDSCDNMIGLAEATLLVTEKYVLLNREITATLTGHDDSRLFDLEELRELVIKSQEELRVVVRQYGLNELTAISA